MNIFPFKKFAINGIYTNCILYIKLIFLIIFLASCSKGEQHFISNKIEGDLLNSDIDMTIDLKSHGVFSVYLHFYNLSTNKRLLINENFSNEGMLRSTTKSYISIKNATTKEIVYHEQFNQTQGASFSDNFISIKLNSGFINLDKGVYHINIKLVNQHYKNYFSNINSYIEFTEWYRAK